MQTFRLLAQRKRRTRHAELDIHLVEGVRRIKSDDGPGLVLSGNSTLTSALLEHGLADEVLLLVYTVAVAQVFSGSPTAVSRPTG